MIRFLTAGESHGKSLLTIVEGFPSNLKIDKASLDMHLKRRQQGYGRGMRMKIESDSATILSGIRGKKTIGSPIALMIENKDWENWSDVMSADKAYPDKISIPRPGHADLNGVIKYNYDDIRNSIERSSARETAARVAAGTLARILLGEFGISIGSYVESIGGVYPVKDEYQDLLDNKIYDFSGWSYSERADKSEVRVIDDEQEQKIRDKIKKAKKKGDTLGGTFVVVATNVPAGLGSFMHFDRKIDAALAASIMSVNAVKGVEIGAGFGSTGIPGSENNDEIILAEEKFMRITNNSGGVEGGITNGMPLLIRAAMKPVSTLMNPVMTIDLKTMKSAEARRERSDFTAVPACAVIAESVTAWTIAEYFLQKFGGDSIEEMKERSFNYNIKTFKRIKKNFKK